MRTTLTTVLALALALSAAACSDYLSGPGIETDPNNPDRLVRPGPLYIGVQAAAPVQFEGQMARDLVQYAQQVAGVGRQSIGYDRYTTSPADVDTYFGAVYGSTRTLTGGGGLLDIRKMQQLARKAGDSLYVGIGKVYEALVMSYAADIWGDLPYREAADSTKRAPAYDPQLQIYADLLAQLDSATTIYLPASGPTNLGPAQDNAELVFGGREAELPTLYARVAHSLKARIYLHLAEVNPANYALALAEVGPPGLNNGGPGIASPSDDFLWYHDATPNGNFIWWQFNAARAGDIAPGAAIIEILKRRIAAGAEDDARLNYYFLPASGPTPADFFGFRPSGAGDLQAAPGVYNGTAPGGNFAAFNAFMDGGTPPGDFRLPEISWAETQLIGAEAALASGSPALAQQYLDAVRANRVWGATGGARVTFPPLGSVPATLQNIMEEKYVTLYLNPEVWNDYKRTCLPALAPTPAAGSTAPGTSPIPGRLPYSLTEANANPNTPTSTNSAGFQISPTGRNPNDPNPCPVLNYLNSTPLAN